jgi:RNA polymerase sigma-70 factor (ECF subfamily)
VTLGPAPRTEPHRAVDPRAGASFDLDDVYRRFGAVVHGIALAYVGPGDADDVVQDVFLRAATRLGTLRDPAALPGWLCALARNAALDRLRDRKRRRAVPVEPDMATAHADPAGDAALRARVLALLGTLPETLREALVLRLVEGLSGPEIAVLTGATPGAVRVTLHRGMALLRPLLEKEGWR